VAQAVAGISAADRIPAAAGDWTDRRGAVTARLVLNLRMDASNPGPCGLLSQTVVEKVHARVEILRVKEVAMTPNFDVPDGAPLDRRLTDIGWGLLFMLTGLIWIVPEQQVPDGAWLFGVAAILIGINAVRYVKQMPISGFSLVLGFLALLAALGQLWRVDLPLLAICLFVIGASIVAKPWLTRHA
jgi:hypothetical protein